MNISGVIDQINKPNAQPGDYTGEDGLLWCGKCHTPKQIRGEGVLKGKILSITCECKKKELEEEAQREKCRKANELREIGLPVPEMRNHTFDSANDAKHIQLARRYVSKWEEIRRKNIGLILWGNTGTGKTFTAHCIANALMDQLIPVRVITAVNLVSRLMEKDGRETFIKKIMDIPLLIIDDVGAERDTPFSREQLCAVIDARGETGRPLIVTTNYSLEEMNSCTDHAMQRIFNRLKALCVPVAVIGESRRDSIGAQKIREAREILEL